MYTLCLLVGLIYIYIHFYIKIYLHTLNEFNSMEMYKYSTPPKKITKSSKDDFIYSHIDLKQNPINRNRKL